MHIDKKEWQCYVVGPMKAIYIYMYTAWELNIPQPTIENIGNNPQTLLTALEEVGGGGGSFCLTRNYLIIG